MSGNSPGVHERALLVAGFLGGIAFAGMVLLIGDSAQFSKVAPTPQGWTFVQVNTFLLALSSISFIFASFGMMYTSSPELPRNDWLLRFTSWTFSVGVTFLIVSMGVIEFVVFPDGGVVIVVISFALLMIFQHIRKGPILGEPSKAKKAKTDGEEEPRPEPDSPN